MIIYRSFYNASYYYVKLFLSSIYNFPPFAGLRFLLDTRQYRLRYRCYYSSDNISQGNDIFSNDQHNRRLNISIDLLFHCYCSLNKLCFYLPVLNLRKLKTKSESNFIAAFEKICGKKANILF